MSYSLPLRNPPRFGHHKHFRAEVAYVFTATTAMCIGLLPVWGCEEFSVDCIRPISIIISPWKLLAQAEEQQPQSIATFPPLTLAGAPLCTPSAAPPTWQVLQPPGAQSPSRDMNHAEGTRHGSCCRCLPLGKGGVNGRKYRGKRIKTEQVRVLSCLA